MIFSDPSTESTEETGSFPFSSLKPVVRSTNLSEQVAMQIAQMISEGKWKAGEKFPSEAEFSNALGVSRSTVREALKSLAFVGLVKMHTGKGTYLAGSPPKFLYRVLASGLLKSERDIRDLTDSRIALETELVALCAQRATDEELQALEEIVREMESTVNQSGVEFLELDLKFHMAIATYSKNRILAPLLATIRSLLQELIRKTAETPGNRVSTCADHKKILEALKARNRRKARSAMRKHLEMIPRWYKDLQRTSESSYPE